MKKSVISLILFIAFAALFSGAAKPVYAASADITISAAETRYEIGESVPVIITIEAEVIPGEFEAFINYDPEVLQYMEGPECVAGGEGTLRLSDMYPEGSRNSRKYVIYFAAIGRGRSDIGFRSAPELYEYESGYLMSVSTGAASIEVVAGYGASDDATLSALRISPGSLVPEFDPEINEYSTRVNNDVTRLIISAKVNDDKATVDITGADKLSEGQNRIVILVTAENGTENKYVIYAVRSRQEEASVQPGTEIPTGSEEPAIPENGEMIGVSAVSEEGRVVLYSSARYTVVSVDSEGIVIPSGYKKTSIILSGCSIPAFVPENDPESDFLLLTLQKEGCAPGVYTYDRAEKTLQRYVSAAKVTPVPTQNEESVNYRELTESYEKSLGSLTVAIMILCAVCAILLIVVIRLFMKNRGIKNDELDY